MPKTLILGVGSSILTDDAVGLVVARRLEERLGHRDDVEFGENEEAGFTLLEEAIGYDRLVLVDSILTGAAPGTLLRYDLSDLGRSIHVNSPHGLNLATVMAFGRQQGLDVPDTVVIYAVEVVDLLTFGESLTPAVAEAECVEGVVEEIVAEVFPDEVTGPDADR